MSNEISVMSYKIGELANGSGWDILDDHTNNAQGAVSKVAPGSRFDKAVTSADVVNTRLISFLITEPDPDPDKKPWPWPWDDEGCNAGVPLLAALALAGLALRRKF